MTLIVKHPKMHRGDCSICGGYGHHYNQCYYGIEYDRSLCLCGNMKERSVSKCEKCMLILKHLKKIIHGLFERFEKEMDENYLTHSQLEKSIDCNIMEHIHPPKKPIRCYNCDGIGHCLKSCPNMRHKFIRN